MRRQGTQKKSELQMGIEPMTFCTLVGRSTTEPQELIWRARSLNWVMTHGLYHTAPDGNRTHDLPYTSRTL